MMQPVIMSIIANSINRSKMSRAVPLSIALMSATMPITTICVFPVSISVLFLSL